MKVEFKISFFTFCAWIFYSVILEFNVNAQTLGFGLNNTDPIHIEASEGIEWHKNKKLYIARGDAKARQGRVTVFADELLAHYRSTETGSEEIYKINANGNVSIESDTDKATSDKAIYDVLEGALIMTGKRIRFTTPLDTIVARKSLEYYEKENLAIARGDAIAIRDDKRLRADILKAHFIANQGDNNSTKIDLIKATGNVHLSTATDIVTAENAVYKVNEGLVSMNGSVKISRGQTQLNGDRAEVNLNTGVSRLLTMVKGQKKSNERVRGIFMPSILNKDNDLRRNK